MPPPEQLAFAIYFFSGWILYGTCYVFSLFWLVTSGSFFTSWYDVAFAEGKSCFAPTLSLSVVRLYSHACTFLVRLQELGISNQLAMNRFCNT